MVKNFPYICNINRYIMTIDSIIKTFNKHQLQMFNILNKENKYQFRVPTI